MKEDKYGRILRDAQYRKALSISFFSATNAGIELYKNSNLTDQDKKAKIIETRNWLLEEHLEYYASVIASVGKNYNAKESIEKLESTSNLDELKEVWLIFSEDERRDDEIVKVKNQLKEQYENA